MRGGWLNCNRIALKYCITLQLKIKIVFTIIQWVRLVDYLFYGFVSHRLISRQLVYYSFHIPCHPERPVTSHKPTDLFTILGQWLQETSHPDKQEEELRVIRVVRAQQRTWMVEPEHAKQRLLLACIICICWPWHSIINTVRCRSSRWWGVETGGPMPCHCTKE